MNTASITRILLKNFRCFKNEEIKFNSTNGLKLLGGENQQEKRLGANGAGKSSIWEGLCWALFGTGVKGAKTASVLSWGTEEKVEVEVTLDLSGELFTIRRFGPPMKVEVNGKPAEQKDVEELIGLSRLRFLHAIVFGQGVPLFPDLTVPERGELFDEVLNLGIWSKCSDAATKKHTLLEKELSNKKVMLSFIEGKISGIKSEEQIQIEIDAWEASRQSEVAQAKENESRWEKTNKETIAEIDARIKSWESLLHEKVVKLFSAREAWRKDEVAKCEAKAAEVEALEVTLASCEKELSELIVVDVYPAEKALRENEVELSDKQGTLRVNQRELDTYEKAEELWKKNTCPTCEQPISPQKRDEKQQFFDLKKKSLLSDQETLRAEIVQLNAKIVEQRPLVARGKDIASRADERRNSLNKEITGIKRDIDRIETEVNKAMESVTQATDPLSQQIAEAQAEKNPYLSQKAEFEASPNPYTIQLSLIEKRVNPYVTEQSLLKVDRAKFAEEKVKAEEACRGSEELMLAAEYWKQGFKRIRLYFVQQILNALEIEIQSAISALGLQGWQIKLSTETETKSGTMKLGIQIRVKSPTSESTWDSWSGGETQRLRLAVAMGLASLIQRAAGVWFNIEVWDEPTNWLGAEGIEDLLEALKYRADSQKKAVWVIDHRALTYSGFKEIYTVCKEATGSKVYLVSEAEM